MKNSNVTSVTVLGALKVIGEVYQKRAESVRQTWTETMRNPHEKMLTYVTNTNSILILTRAKKYNNKRKT